MERRIFLPLLPALIAGTLAACSSGTDSATGEDTPSQNSSGGAKAPQNVPVPEDWTWVEGADLPSVSAEAELPVTVTDGTGTEVTVHDASKIIVGGEDVADILAGLGLGDLVYAAPTNSVAEAALAAPEQFEFNKTTGTEGLLAVDCTLFIGNNTARHGKVAEQFRDAGVDAVVVDDQQSVADKIRAVASYVGAKDAGEELAGKVEKQLEQAATAAGDTVRDTRVLVVTASGAGGANAVVGGGTAAADILEAVGATSVGVDEGLRGYSVEFSDEGLLKTQPDVILTGGGDLQEWKGIEGFLEAFPTLADTPAGQDSRFLVMPSEQIKVSGVGVGAGAIALAKALADAVS